MKDTKLIISIESLRESIDKSNSIGWTFLLGLVRGVGAVIGATIVAALVFGLLSMTFETIAEIPVVGEYIAEFIQSLEIPDSIAPETTSETAE